MSGFAIQGATHPDGQRADIFVDAGILVDHAPARARLIDADGLIVLPGLVDLHTHLREPGGEATETIASGTLCAAHGGFTAVSAMPNTNPVTDTAARANHIVDLASCTAHAQVAVVGAVTRGEQGCELADLTAMAGSRAGVRMFSDDGHAVMNSRLLRDAMNIVAHIGGVIAQHSQDHDLAGVDACADEGPIAEQLGVPGWPWAAESDIIARDVQLAAATHARLHVCHVSTAAGVDVVRWAKAKGIAVSAEAAPHHLYFTSAELAGADPLFKVNPPLRSEQDREALRAGLADGTIDIVATDHAPHSDADKALPLTQAKPGMLGLEQVLGVVIETMVNPGRIGWADVARVLSQAPAHIGQIPGQGRPLRPGEPANLVLVDPTARSDVKACDSASTSHNNPYLGRNLPHPVQLTMWRGQITYQR